MAGLRLIRQHFNQVAHEVVPAQIAAVVRRLPARADRVLVLGAWIAPTSAVPKAAHPSLLANFDVVRVRPGDARCRVDRYEANASVRPTRPQAVLSRGHISIPRDPEQGRCRGWRRG